jgi:16S rRNA (guanine966-N2)-methyltransferase
MRVVAGSLGGRRLVAPPGRDTRPTSDKVRLAIFNSLSSAGVLDDAAVVDLFAGSGALGIEALSRGADRCTFVEKDRDALAALRENIKTLGLADRASVVAGDAVSYVRTMGPVDLVLVDPPYPFTEWASLLIHLDAGLVVAESDRQIEGAGWDVIRSRRYGRTYVTTLARPAVHGVDSPPEQASPDTLP